MFPEWSCPSQSFQLEDMRGTRPSNPGEVRVNKSELVAFGVLIVAVEEVQL